MKKSELMQLVIQSGGVIEESFTWVEEGSTTETTFLVTAMREKFANRQPIEMEVPPDFLDTLKATRDIDMDRVNDPTLDINDPVLVIDWGDSHLLVDGTHRCCRRVMLGMKTILVRMIERHEALIHDGKSGRVVKDLWGEQNYLAK